MARSKCSNQRPDTLMQARSPPARRNHLQRTAGPYIRVLYLTSARAVARPAYLNERTSSGHVGRSEKYRNRTHAQRGKARLLAGRPSCAVATLGSEEIAQPQAGVCAIGPLPLAFPGPQSTGQG